MPREINYSHVANRAEREALALNDLINWLGADVYGRLRSEVLRYKPATLSEAKATVYTVRVQLSMFAGVSGYPVTAFLKSVFKEWRDGV